MDFLSKHCLFEMMELEQRLLKEKHKLVLCDDFTPASAHRLFSLSTVKKLQINDFKEGVESLGVSCSQQ